MKKTIIMLITASALGISCTEKEPVLTPEQQTLQMKLVGDCTREREEGSILIKVDARTAGIFDRNNQEEAIRELGVDIPVRSVRYALGVRPKNTEVARKYGLDKWYVVEYDKDTEAEDMALALSARPQIKAIQYNSFIDMPTPVQTAPYLHKPVTKGGAEATGMPFNDPYLPSQWNMINDGSMEGSVAGADIGVKDAWKLTAGDPSIIVAVFDCAVNNIHEDLRKAVWVNTGEDGKNKNTDDDGNGYIDDVYGFNFVKCTIEKDEGGNLLSPIKGNILNWTSRSGHGTHCAGVIGAVNGNGKGISSIAGGTGNNDGVRLMTCQIFDGNSSALDANRAQAYIYAADNGACIAQCSYGNTEIITEDDIYINGNDDIEGSPLENLALRYFLDPENSNHECLDGNIAVYSSMNEANPYSGYPGALPYCVSVSAFGYDFTPSWYSNYGPGVKISAPGGEFSGESDKQKAILSTGVTNAQIQSPEYTDADGKGNGNYVYMNGTSMACPHVSGVVALGIAYAKKLGKKLSRDEFLSKLLTSVNDLDQYCTGTKIYNGNVIDLSKYKGNMGTGALDAWKFLMAIEGTPVIMAKPGIKRSIRIADYIGNREYTMDFDAQAREALGIISEPVITDEGMLEFTCTKVGAGKITFRSSVGKDPDKENGIGAMDYCFELSIACRNNIASNGGWL